MHFDIKSLLFYIKSNFQNNLQNLLLRKIIICVLIVITLFSLKRVFKKLIDGIFFEIDKTINNQKISFDQILFMFFCLLYGVFQGISLSSYKFYALFDFIIIMNCIFYNFYYSIGVLLSGLLMMIYFKKIEFVIWIGLELMEFIILWKLSKKNKFTEYFIHIKFIFFLLFTFFLIAGNILINFSLYNTAYVYTNSFASSNVVNQNFMDKVYYCFKILKSTSLQSIGIHNFTDFINKELSLLFLFFHKNYINRLQVQILANFFNVNVIPDLENIPIFYYLLLMICLSLFSLGMFINSYILTMIFFYLSLCFMGVFAIYGLRIIFKLLRFNFPAILATMIFFHNTSLFFLSFFFGIFYPLFN